MLTFPKHDFVASVVFVENPSKSKIHNYEFYHLIFPERQISYKMDTPDEQLEMNIENIENMELKDVPVVDADYDRQQNDIMDMIFTLLDSKIKELVDLVPSDPNEVTDFSSVLMFCLETEVNRIFQSIIDQYQLDVTRFKYPADDQYPSDDEMEEEIEEEPLPVYKPPVVPSPRNLPVSQEVLDYMHPSHDRFCEVCETDIQDRPKSHKVCFKCYKKFSY